MYNKKGYAKILWWVVGIVGSALTIAFGIVFSKFLLKWWGVE
jgi:hypothetical protein